jgi:HAD superfamily phosphoserine phosphatase-like hydrolase
MKKPKLIVFDLNRTLIEENSWRDLNMALGVKPAEDDILVNWGHEGIISDALGQQILCEIYKKRGEPTRHHILSVLGNYVYTPGAEELVAELKQRGYTLALISGSMDLLTEKVARDVGIGHWRANNQFIFDNNDLLERIETKEDDAEYKLNELESLCNELQIELKDCMCVGDGANDLKLFEATGNGVTFGSSPYADRAKHTIEFPKDVLDLVP